MLPKNYAQLLYEVLENKTTNQQDAILERFRKLLMKNKDAHLTSAVRKELQKIQAQKEQERTTYISSASKLTASQKRELEKISAEPREFSQNPSLLGGVAVRQKDKVYNATVRKKIETLKWQL